MVKAGSKYLSSAFSAIIVILMVFCSTNCKKINEDNRKPMANLQIDLGVQDQTKSIVTGSTLNENGRTYGIIVCKHEDEPQNFEPYDEEQLYGNIQAWYGNYNSKGTKWWYSYQQTSDIRFSPLYLVTEDTSRKLDIYAYYPWKSGTNPKDGYDFDISLFKYSDMIDPMYATYENTVGEQTNRDITIINKKTIPVNINFHHVLTRLIFHFKLSNTISPGGLDGEHYLRISKIELVRNDKSKTPLYTQGKLNILSGAITPTQATSQKLQTVTYSGSMESWETVGDVRQSGWTNLNFLINPVDYKEDGDFSFKFYFIGSVASYSPNLTYEIKRNDLLHNDGVTYGFKPGYSYHFYFTIDNYIHLKDVVIDSEWINTDEQEIKI